MADRDLAIQTSHIYIYDDSQSDEDIDEDKPIMQTLKHHDQDDSVPVSAHTLYPIHCSQDISESNSK